MGTPRNPLMVALWVPRIGPAWVKVAIFKGYIFVSCGCKFFLAYLTHTWPTWAPTVTPSLLVGVNRERTFLILGQFQRQITYLVNFEYFLTNWTCSVLGVEQTNSVTQLDMRGFRYACKSRHVSATLLGWDLLSTKFLCS